jgi:hypothetical protein
MSRLTQRKAGRSDNNEVGQRPWFDASMTWRIGSMLEHWPGRYARKHIPAIYGRRARRIWWTRSGTPTGVSPYERRADTSADPRQTVSSLDV